VSYRPVYWLIRGAKKGQNNTFFGQQHVWLLMRMRPKVFHATWVADVLKDKKRKPKDISQTLTHCSTLSHRQS